MANFTDEELCIIAIILNEETEETKVHEAWQNRVFDTIYVHIFWI
jgi:hypothetical protein